MKKYIEQLTKLPAGIRSRLLRRVVLIFLAGCAIAAMAAWDAHSANRAAAKISFDSIADKVVTAIRENMDTYEQVLRGGVALFDAMGEVSRQQWAIYVDALDLSTNYSGIQGIGYVAVVDPQGISKLEERAHSEGLSEFKVHPPGIRELNTAILYLEPMDWRNRRALGYDMYAEDVRRVAMRRAWKTENPSLSRAVTLLQETGESVQKGVVLFLPVFSKEPAGAPPSEEVQKLKGFVFSPFRMRDLISQVLARTPSYSPNLLRVEIFDGPAAKQNELLFDSGAASEKAAHVDPAAFVIERLAIIHGATWEIRLTSLPAFEHRPGPTTPPMIFAFGLVLGTLTASLFGVVSIGKEAAHIAANQLTAEVEIRKKAEEQTRVALRELGHRVKNTLTIVTAIASQSVRHSESLQEFDGKFRTRLLGLSRVHDLLTSSRSYSTDLSALAHEVLTPYKGDHDGSLSLSGPATVLVPNTAIMLSMLFNELATNATKYGAWANKSGRVSLSWEIVGSGDEKSLNIIWQERFGPPVTPPSRNGFGSNVIKFSVERSLRGKADADYAPEGATYNISIPWSSIAPDK